MSTRFLSPVLSILAVSAVLALGMTPAAGQPPVPTPPEAHTWDPPRTPDGQPDIQGVWSQQNRITTYSIQSGEADRETHIGITGQTAATGEPIIDPPNGRIPYQPWAAERAQFLFDEHWNPSKIEYIDPVSRGFLDSLPRINYRGVMKIVQTPGQVIMINEFNHTYRVIPLDGSPHIGSDIKLWMGDSRGHWEGNTLVVEATNFNEHSWLDIVGSFHSDALHLVERWTFVNPDRIDYEVTLEDPKVYARPWKLLVNHGRMDDDYELWESAVWEGNNAVEVILGAPPEISRSRW